MSSKNYVYYMFSLIIILVGLFYFSVYNYKIYYLNKEYVMWIDIQKRISITSNQSIDYLILGDSRAKAAFIPSVLKNGNINAINLSVGGGTPIEGFYTLQTYLENHKSPKFLVLSYAPFHLTKQDQYWNRTIRFNFLRWKDYFDIYYTSLKLEGLATIGKKNSYIDWVINPARYIAEVNNGVCRKRWRANFNAIKYLEKSGGHYFFGRLQGSSGMNQETKLKLFIPSALLDYYLDKVLDLASRKNIPVYWYTVPFNKTSYDHVTTSFKTTYNAYIEQKKLIYDLTLLNTLNYTDDKKFGDNSHLYSGAEEITRDLMKSINEAVKLTKS